jgi:hypothetical protein
LNKDVFKTLLFGGAVKEAGKEYQKNREFYHDLVRFQFRSSPNLNKRDRVFYSDLPDEARKMVTSTYKKLANLSTPELFNRLGTCVTLGNKYSPLEAKWAFEYYRKFKTAQYNCNNKVTEAELLRPLNKAELARYKQLF